MIIVKVGGGEGIELDPVCEDLARRAQRQERTVLVHGGSHLTNQVAEKLGHAPRFITSPSGYTSRLTDRATLEIFEMVYCGKVNKDLVERLQRRGVNAIGLSGLDGGLWRGPRKRAVRAVTADGRTRVIRDNLTGRVEKVNTVLLRTLLDAGHLPVLTPPALSYGGEAINVDGDRAAAATASALRAETLVILSNVPGLLRDLDDPNSLIQEVSLEALDEVTGYANGRMRIKLLGVQEALESGVQRVIIADARQPQPVARALKGAGTVFRRQQVAA